MPQVRVPGGPLDALADSGRFLTTRYEQAGTRFLIYPQFKGLKDFGQPETVYLNAAPRTIKAGPQDDGIYVVDAPHKIPYEKSGEQPPYAGPRRPPARPDSDGHFDHIKPGDEEFFSATIFATIRLVLAIWEHYLGRKVRWFFRDTYPRLEVIPRVPVGNAFSKLGYIECGFDNVKRRSGPFCQNFDVVAHEAGHIILKDVIGYPPYRTVELRAHEEASADLVSLVSVLHFRSVVKYLLGQTKGNLYSLNVLSRIAELSKARHIRGAFNAKTMSKVKWDPIPDKHKYDLALPFLGAAYDTFVEIYQRELVRLGAIPKSLERRCLNARGKLVSGVQAEFAKHFKGKERAFERALVDARDAFANLLARTWAKTSMHDLTFPRVAGNMIDADKELHQRKYVSVIRNSFVGRKILPKEAV